jgi:hypothetical protein
MLSNDIYHIREEVFTSLDGQIKINIDTILYMPSAKIYFPVEFQVISNIFLFIS